MSKVIIHQFDPVIYPRKVWVCLGATKETLEERFDFNNELDDDMFINGAVTIMCKEIETELWGFMVLSPKKVISINWIAHESCHVADMIFDFIGESTKTDECHAYLVGWVAECIEKAMKYKKI